MDYQLFYSAKRKTIALQIKHGQVVVRAPSFLAKAYVDSFVLTKKSWIEKRLTLSQKNKLPSFNYQDGQYLYIKGVYKRFTVIEDKTIRIVETDTQLIISLTTAELNSYKSQVLLQGMLEQWLCQEVDMYLTNQLKYYANLTQLSYRSVKVRFYKSRWGSCNSRKQLTFNALLAMAPSSVIDYVIVHELCHLKYMDHSADFWALVGNYLPTYQSERQWLKMHQRYLTLPPVITKNNEI